jgi:hypothetical protein
LTATKTPLAGKQAIVTGAGSGIGAALCRFRWGRLDVIDGDAVQAAVDDVVERTGENLTLASGTRSSTSTSAGWCMASIGFVAKQRRQQIQIMEGKA